MADTVRLDPALRWTFLHPEHWTSTEVAGWVDSVATANSMADQDRHVISQAFETVTGTQLIAMKKEDFVGILGNNGDFMYQTFRTMYLAVPNLDGKGQADPRSLTPISEKTDSDSSPEPDPDPRHCPGPPTESSQHLERRGGGNGNSLKTDSCDR